ncbi:MAG TPA: hypothetical protein VFF44_10245 [Casimicrobiaceae bacterium]|nr:hypothetical protein [Casimicrobiaceae bacterium]
MIHLLRTVALAAVVFAASGTPVRAGIAVAVEYYDAALDHYFVTAIPAEVAALDGGQFPGWVRTGLSFNVYAAGSATPGSTPVCRFYGSPAAGLDSHFYSASPAECQMVLQRFPTAWLLESYDVFEVFLPDLATGQCPTGSIPVYRAWNTRADSNHRYTTDLTVLQAMLAKGYVAEGYGPGPAPTAMCSPSTGGGNAPVCAPSASDTAPYVGTTVTLFANCSGNPTSFTWGGCPGAGGRCDVTSSVPGTLTYTVAATNAAGTGAPAPIDLHWRALPPVPQCGMVVTTNTAPPVVGSSAVLAAACSNTPTSYNWTNCTSAGAICPAQSGTAGPVNYSVSGSNAGGTGAPASRSVNWVATTPPPPGLCSQYPSYLFSDLGWTDALIHSRDFTDAPGFAWNAVWVVKLSVPPDASSTQTGKISIAEFDGPPTSREVTISRFPCDFRTPDPSGNNGPLLRDESAGPTEFFVLGASSGGKVGLAPGLDYYVNIRNWNASTSSISCDSSIRCDALFFISLP